MELGADQAVSEGLDAATAAFTRGHGADAVIVTASTKSSAPVNQAAEVSRMKGRVVVVGMVGMTIDREPFYKRELDLRLSMSYGPGRYDPAYEVDGHDYPLPYVRWTEQRNMEAFLELIASGRVTPSRLVTHRYPIEDAESAYKLMDGSEPYLAILLTYPDEPAAPSHVVEVGKAAAPAGGDGVAFIGFGNYAKSVLLPAFRKAGGGSLRTVVTSTGISAHRAAEKAGFARAATDAEEAFADSSVSTVFIATRHDSHAELAERALRAGKHVFVEKPLALTPEDLDRVLATAREAPGLLTVGFNRRFAPMVVEAKKAIGARRGPLNMIYRVNAGFIPKESWLHGSEGGGRIIGEVCHFVDTLSAIAGAPPIAAEAVSPDEVSDSVAGILRFADGSVATILYSSLGDPAVSKERLEIFGSGVVVEIDDYSAIRIARGGKITQRKATQDKGQVDMLRAFRSATAAGGPPPISLDDIEAVHEATFALAGHRGDG
jgi:predicted dehydrogenase